MGDQHICPDCVKCVGLCSFSANLTPVKGWTAERVFLKNNGKRTFTYRVTACPLYERDSRMAVVSENTAKWTAKEDAALLSAVGSRLKISTIAEALNRTEKAVWTRLRKLRKEVNR